MPPVVTEPNAHIARGTGAGTALQLLDIGDAGPMDYLELRTPAFQRTLHWLSAAPNSANHPMKSPYLKGSGSARAHHVKQLSLSNPKDAPRCHSLNCGAESRAPHHSSTQHWRLSPGRPRDPLMTIPIDNTLRFPSDLPELVAAAVSGNRAAWNSLVERFEPLVTSVIRRFRLNESDADDVRQNTWLRLVEHLKDLREPRALPGWIATTTRNEALRVLSARRRVEPVDPHVDARLDTFNKQELVANLLLAERRKAVHGGLAKLQAAQRDLLMLLFADPEVSYRQISRRLGMPIGSIGPTRARCLQKLKDTTDVRALAS